MKKFYEAPSTEIIIISTQDIVSLSVSEDTQDDTQDDCFDNVRISWFE